MQPTKGSSLQSIIIMALNSLLSVIQVIHTHTYTVATSGRIDRMFQVLPDQESSLIVKDMKSDFILVVEMETEIPLVTPGPTSASAVISRLAGRKQSYGK